MQRHVPDLGLGLLAPGDVGEDGDVVADASLTIAHHADGQVLGIHTTVLAPVPDLPFPAPVQQHLFPQGLIKGLIVHAGAEQSRIATDHLGGFIAGDAREGRVGGDDAVARIGDEDALVAVLEHPGVEAHGFLQTLARGDIHGQPDHRGAVEDPGPHGHDAPFEPQVTIGSSLGRDTDLLGAQGIFQGLKARGLQGLVHHRQEAVRQLQRQYLVQALADQRLPPVVQLAVQAAEDIPVLPLVVDDETDVRQCPDDGVEPLMAVEQLVGQPLAVIDVGNRRQYRRPVLPRHGAQVDAHVAVPRITGADAKLRLQRSGAGRIGDHPGHESGELIAVLGDQEVTQLMRQQ